MTPRQLRKFMLKNRVFLHLLYRESKKDTAQRLNYCTNVQANCVLHILKGIATGEIPLKKEDYAALRKTKKLGTIEQLVDKTTFRALLRNSRSEKVTFLRKVVSLFPLLLRLLFEPLDNQDV